MKDLFEHPVKVAIGVLIFLAALAGMFLLIPSLWPGAFLDHWVYNDLYQNMWSNIFAPSAITLAAVVIAYLKSRWHRARLHEQAMDKADAHHAEVIQQQNVHHEALKQHITNTLGTTNGQT